MCCGVLSVLSEEALEGRDMLWFFIMNAMKLLLVFWTTTGDFRAKSDSQKGQLRARRLKSMGRFPRPENNILPIRTRFTPTIEQNRHANNPSVPSVATGTTARRQGYFGRVNCGHHCSVWRASKVDATPDPRTITLRRSVKKNNSATVWR